MIVDKEKKSNHRKSNTIKKVRANPAAKRNSKPTRKYSAFTIEDALPPPPKLVNNFKAVTNENFLAVCEQWRIDPDTPIPLTIQEEKWCRMYFRCGNKCEATRYAYPSQVAPTSYSYIVSKKPEVRLRLAQLWYEERKRLRLDEDAILTELGRISSIDIRDFIYVDEDGNEQLRDDYDGRAVRSIKRYVDKGKQRIEIQFWNKDHALENFGRYYKMFTDNLNAAVRGKINITISDDFAPEDDNKESE